LQLSQDYMEAMHLEYKSIHKYQIWQKVNSYVVIHNFSAELVVQHWMRTSRLMKWQGHRMMLSGNAHILGFPWAPTPAPTPPGESHQIYTSRTIATVRAHHETRPVSNQQLRRVQRAASFVSSAVYHWDISVQCKPTSEQLMMRGRYPHIDTSPHNVIMVNFKVLLNNLAGKTLNSQILDRDLHPGSSKHECVENWSLILHSGEVEKAGQREIHSIRKRQSLNVWNLVLLVPQHNGMCWNVQWKYNSVS
jgi:hypothetical protein